MQAVAAIRPPGQAADPRTDRLYYGKAFIYAVAAAPFVWLFGLNGLLVLHVLLLFGRLRLRIPVPGGKLASGPSLMFALAFVGASCVPVYAVFLAPEVFNFTLVFVAYFLWAYKEVAPPDAGRAGCGARRPMWPRLCCSERRRIRSRATRC